MRTIDVDGKCTVLVNSCDTYSDLWDPFFKLFKKYWPDCPYEVVLNTESKQYIDDNLNVTTINFRGKANAAYGQRMQSCLKSVKTPYVILLLDDFFLREPVNTAFIRKTIQYLEEYPDIVYFNFDIPSDRYDIDDGRFAEYRKRSKYGAYKYNMQAGIWRTEELYKAWKSKESPWQWELYGNVRSWTDKKFYILKENQKTPLEYGYYPDAWGVYRGKWVLEDVKPLFDANGIDIDYSLRGIYEKKNEEKPQKHVILPKIYSYGIYRYLCYVRWYLQKRTKRQGTHSTGYSSYADDMNHLYYKSSKNAKI